MEGKVRGRENVRVTCMLDRRKEMKGGRTIESRK
jgi:hypothetical protein